MDWEKVFATRAGRMKASEIRELLKLLAQPDIISFAGGIPDPKLFPDQAFREAYADIFATSAGEALQYSVSEGYPPLREWIAAHMATIGVTLVAGVELGVISGVGVGLMLYLWRASRPHAAIVGRVPETEHFRNIERHNVFTVPHVLSIRIDEALTYLNARWLEEYVLEQVADRPAVRSVILMCSAINEIDASGLESLEAINHRLGDGGVVLHLSEVKGPVMDRLKRTHFLEDLSGKVFLSQDRAYSEAMKDDGQGEVSDDPLLARGMI